MKKLHFFGLGVIAAVAISCNGGSTPSTNVKLETAADTLAYAYGATVAGQGLTDYLSQSGTLMDTARFRFEQNHLASMEQDSVKREELMKKIDSRIDSLNKANQKNMGELMKGINEALKADKSKSAYFKGLEVGSQLSQMPEAFSKQVYGPNSEETINKDAFFAGVLAALKNETILVENPQEVFQSKIQVIQEEKTREQFKANIEEGEKFLAENKEKDGVITLPNGLQYKIIKEGKGAKPTAENTVKVHYHGTLLDGTVFDSSTQRGEPTTFGVGQVIRGWTEALQLMPVGSKWILYIPQDLAYGSRPAGSIPPYSTLIFEVELLSIEK